MIRSKENFYIDTQSKSSPPVKQSPFIKLKITLAISDMCSFPKQSRVHVRDLE
jgi:hypothetical protein